MIDDQGRKLVFAVTDNFELAGIPTFVSSTLWAALYGPASRTATIVKSLTDRDARIVGKTARSRFGDEGDKPFTLIDLDRQAYSRPGASHGPGAAVAAFDWLDFAVGTDGKQILVGRRRRLTTPSGGRSLAVSSEPIGVWL